jgi:hypothetical protein
VPEVELHCIERHGRMLWRVIAGKRVLTFHEEMAARTFAAQLHLRLNWLQAQRQAEQRAD